MLTFIGLGLYDTESITLRGQRHLQQADRVFAEFYTSQLAGATVDELATAHDVDIVVCDRAAVERDPEVILDAAETESVAFLTGGDPMIATTHVDLRLRAAQRGIETKIVHGVSAQAAASSLSGLQNYRFGPATTVPFPGTHGGTDPVPVSVLETIAANYDRDLHTLAFLDIDADRDRYLSADRAAGLLAAAGPDRVGVAIARAGSSEPVVVADRLGTLAERTFGPPLHLLVLPGAVHPLEEAALRQFAGLPADVSLPKA